MYIMLRWKILKKKIPNITNLVTNTTVSFEKIMSKTKYLVLLT